MHSQKKCLLFFNAFASWLKGFQDTQLNALVQDGLAVNFDLQAGAGRWPQLYFAPEYLRCKNTTLGDTTEYGAFNTLFTLSWELDVWGRIKAGQQPGLCGLEGLPDTANPQPVVNVSKAQPRQQSSTHV